jgi:orotate phosphoribosyltransferase
VEAVGGLTMGADPIAYATSLISFQKNTPIKSFSVRKTPKGHGTGKRLEGDLRRGDRVVVVEDVITSGGSVISAIQAAREEGLDIVQVIVLVDREEGGREAVEKLGVPLQVVFTLPELQAAQVSR